MQLIACQKCFILSEHFAPGYYTCVAHSHQSSLGAYILDSNGFFMSSLFLSFGDVMLYVFLCMIWDCNFSQVLKTSSSVTLLPSTRISIYLTST